MPKKKYSISLTKDEIKELNRIVKTGTSKARVNLRARIILASDSSAGKPPTVVQTAKQCNTSTTTVQSVRTAYANGGLDAALYRKKRETPPVPPKVDGEIEAKVIALCCSEPPEGYARWTLRLVAQRCVELEYIDSISHMTVKRILKKTNLSLT